MERTNGLTRILKLVVIILSLLFFDILQKRCDRAGRNNH